MKLLKAFMVGLMALAITTPTFAQVVPAPAKEPPKMQVPKMAGDETPKEDDLIIIQGPKLGQARPAEPTPAQLEAFYRAIWEEVGKRYVDPDKIKDWASWERKFNGKITNAAELDAALKAMVESVGDRWTVYTSPAEIEAARAKAESGDVPSGMMLRKDAAGNWRIDGMMYNSPAQQSVLREGDVVKAIGRGSEAPKELSTLSSGDVEELTSGKVGEKIVVVATWGGADHKVELTFAPPAQDGVEVGLLPGKIGYIRLPTFMSQEVVGTFIQALGQLYAASGGELSGLVFDLRYNGGGRVDLALLVSSLFVERGVITRTTTRENRDVTETYHRVVPLPKHMEDRMPKMAAGFQRMLLSVPMVILVNGSTASASEITTGALVDNGRAIAIGTHTFGKAVGYNRGRLPNGGVLSITTLSYLTPAGTDIGGKGIEANRVVEQPRGGEEDEQLKAAHAYLMEIVKQRAEALAEARDRATAPQTAPDTGKVEPFRWSNLHIALAVMGGLIGLLFAGFVFSTFRARLRRNRWTPPPAPPAPPANRATRTGSTDIV